MAATLVQEIESLDTALTGCPDPLQGSAIITPGVTGAGICRDLKDSNGEIIPLCDYDPAAPHYVMVADAVCAGHGAQQIPLEITDQENGRVCFSLPSWLAMCPGIYQMEWNIINADGNTAIIDNALLSVEPTLAMRKPGRLPSGPLTLAAIRTRLRDYPGLNEYWGEREFSDQEILTAILDPIYYFNEALPSSITFSPANFPFRFHWIEAVVSRLLQMSGTWYMREERAISYADSKTDSNKGKAREYLEVAEMLWQKYQQFVGMQKMRIHWSGGSHSFRGNVQSYRGNFH